MNFYRLKILALFYIGMILLLLALPINTSSELNNITILQLRGDYFFHALLFLPWVFFRPAFHIKQGWWLFGGWLFATGSEGMQYLLPYRSWNVNDLVANNIGMAIGFIILYSFQGIPQRTKNGKKPGETNPCTKKQ